MRNILWLWLGFSLTMPFSACCEPPATQPHVVRIACVGDSITFGTTLQDREVQSYPAQLQAMFGDGFQVQNFGVPGASVCRRKIVQDNWDRSYVSTKQYKASLEFQPQIVVIEIGINELDEWPKQADRFKEDYGALIESYQRLQTKPRVLIAHRLSPIFKGHKDFDRPHIAEINAAIAEVAKRANVETFDLYAPLADRPQLAAEDAIHPTAEGAMAIAVTVKKAIDR